MDAQLISTQVAKLPPELILLIIDALIPSGGSRCVLLPASHTTTQTLLSFTTVCEATYTHASRLLRRHCLYIDSRQRLATLLLCIPRLVPSLPPVLSLRYITSLYLAPFGSSLEDQPTAEWVRELFCEVSSSLRRLVVHMPFGSLHPLDDRLNVRRTLREGFEQLVNLHEFTCLDDYPSLSFPERTTDIWRLWPDLKHLCLFRVPLDSHWLWWDIATLPALRQVVLARPLHVERCNIKDEYFHKLPPDDVRLARKMKVVLLDTAYTIGAEMVNTSGWKEVDPQGSMDVEVYEVPRPFYGDETHDELVTGWVRRGAVDGSLWDWKGRVV